LRAGASARGVLANDVLISIIWVTLQPKLPVKLTFTGTHMRRDSVSTISGKAVEYGGCV
jgi:hypothetical protein